MANRPATMLPIPHPAVATDGLVPALRRTVIRLPVPHQPCPFLGRPLQSLQASPRRCRGIARPCDRAVGRAPQAGVSVAVRDKATVAGRTRPGRHLSMAAGDGREGWCSVETAGRRRSFRPSMIDNVSNRSEASVKKGSIDRARRRGHRRARPRSKGSDTRNVALKFASLDDST